MNRNFVLENDLTTRLLQNDSLAFEEVYSRFFQPIFTYAYKKTKSAADARLITRNLFSKLWTNRLQLDPEVSLSTYLYAELRKSVALQLAMQLDRSIFVYVEKELESEFSAKALARSWRPATAKPMAAIKELVRTDEAVTYHFAAKPAVQWFDLRWISNALRFRQAV